MNTLRQTAETFALNQWLSDYPTNMSYDEIIACISSGKYHRRDDIMIWEPLEDYPDEDIAEMIDDSRAAFERYAADLLSCAHD